MSRNIISLDLNFIKSIVRKTKKGCRKGTMFVFINCPCLFFINCLIFRFSIL